MTHLELRLIQYYEAMRCYMYPDSRWFKGVRDELESLCDDKVYLKTRWWRLPDREWKARESMRQTINTMTNQIEEEIRCGRNEKKKET